MSPYAPSRSATSFGPGPMTPAVRAIIIANVAVFVVSIFIPKIIVDAFGLMPQAVIERGRVWQLGTYLFVHDPFSFMHILFNMLTLWMMGIDLERRWGTREFTKFYFLTGVGAGVSVLVTSLLPFARASYLIPTIGASGAIYGVLLAWALLFPNRQVLFMFVFPLPSRVFVAILGGIAFLSSLAANGGHISHIAHLGGLVLAFLYLKGPKNIRLDWQYRLTKWKMARMRRRFNIHKGGRPDGKPWVH